MKIIFSNWIISILIILVLATSYYINIMEEVDYHNKITQIHNNLVVNSINNHIEHSLYFCTSTINNYNNGAHLDSTTKNIIKDALGIYTDMKEIYYIIIQTNSDRLLITKNEQVLKLKIPNLPNDELFLIHQNSTPQTFKLTIGKKDILEIRNALNLNFNEPMVLRIGLDYSHLSSFYNQHLINTSIITFFLLLIILLFINYHNIFNKRTSSVSDSQNVINVFSKISDNTSNGAIFIDPQQRIRVFNPVASKITGVEKQTALMNDYFQIFPNDYFNVDEVFSSKKSIGITNVQIITEKGVNLDLYYSTSNVIIDDVFTGVLVSIQDVTEINKNINLKTNQMIIHSNSKLATGITSEFLNKINQIYLSFQTLTNKKDISTESIKKVSDTILSVVLEIEQLLHKFQDLTKIDKVSYSQISVNDIIDKVIDSYKSECKNKNIHIQKNFPKFLTFYCDDNLLTEILAVFVENSIYAIDKNGDIIISAEQNLTNTVIKITDTGIGIDESVKEKFYSPYNTTKQNHLGFGLAKVNKYLILLSGEISFQTSKGLGTTFTIILPNRYDLKGQV